MSHVVSVDQEGHRTKAAGHYRVSVGPNPGSGDVAGHVVDATSRPLVGASVTLNRGLYTATTNASGNFSFAGIPAGAWETAVTVGAKTTTKNVTVAKDAIAPADLSL